MTFRQRARFAVDILRGRRMPTQRKLQSPIIWPRMVEGKAQWQIADYQAFVEEGYNINALIYAAIQYKVRSITQAPLQALTGDPASPEPLPPEDPLAMLVARPNPHQSFMEMQQQNIVYLNLAGNVYIFLQRETQDPDVLPSAMFSLRPDRVFIIPGDGGVKGYMYLPPGKQMKDGVPLLPSDIIHIKFPNPGDDLEGMGYGLSPMSALARNADVDNRVTSYLEIFFRRGMMPAQVIEIDSSLDPDDVAMLREQFTEIYGGTSNWWRPTVLDKGAKMKQITPTFDDMGFEVIDARNESRILGPFGVPPMLIGTRLGMQNSSFSNFEQAAKTFWQSTMIPELKLFEVDYAHFLRDGDKFVRFDLSEVPALQLEINPIIDGFTKLFDRGYPRDEAAKIVGLSAPPTADGKVGYLPINIVPIGTPPLRSVTVSDVATVDNDPGKQALLPASTKSRDLFTNEQKRGFNRKVNDIAESHESVFARAAGKQLERDKRRIQSIIHDAARKARSQKATVAWDEVLMLSDSYLQTAGSEAWRDAFTPLISGVVADQGEFWAVEIGRTFSLRAIEGEAWLQDYTLKFAVPNINPTTSQGIHALIAQAQAEGWGIDKTARNMGLLFDQWITGNLSADDLAFLEGRMPIHRREMIARTETIRSANAGADALFRQWDVERKEWVATGDDRTRDSHLIAWAQYTEGGNPGPIGINEFFSVGNSQLRYPGDPIGGADEIIQCRCTVVPVIVKLDPAARPRADVLDRIGVL